MKYITEHLDSEHNYLSSLENNDEGVLSGYDICLECDCVRLAGTTNWIVR